MPQSVKVSLGNEKQIKDFLNINMKSDCEIDVVNGQSYVDGKSVIGLMTLNLYEPLEVYVIGNQNEVEEVKERYQNSNLLYTE
ncbi:hypothetical protein SAMN05216390_1294 [Lachnospiraceae bacterium KH1T2]|nr:hypothetical protein SAMN05216390_1294 [Lachnospiraceae bacterium KH1T2]